MQVIVYCHKFYTYRTLRQDIPSHTLYFQYHNLLKISPSLFDEVNAILLLLLLLLFYFVIIAM